MDGNWMNAVFITMVLRELGPEANMLHWNGNESTKLETNPSSENYESIKETGKQQIHWKYTACFHSVSSHINISSAQLYLVSYT